MIKRRTYLLLAVFLVCLGWMSCKQERPICFTSKDIPLRLSTFQTIERDTGLVIADSSLPNAWIAAIDTGTRVMINASAGQKDFNLYLSPHSDSTRFAIFADSTAKIGGSRFASDTITFYYQRKLEFLSVACGYTYFYSLRSARTTNNNIDSVIIIGAEVNNAPNTKHVKVYY
jgi:hypothetical protein